MSEKFGIQNSSMNADRWGMSAGDRLKQLSRVFRTDQEVLDFALNEFKSERAIFVQEVVDVEGGFAFGERHCFQQEIDMSRWLRKLPRNNMYIVVALNIHGWKLTYRGKKFVVSYDSIDTKPKVTFFKQFDQMPIGKIDEHRLRESVAELVRILKSA